MRESTVVALWTLVRPGVFPLRKVECELARDTQVGKQLRTAASVEGGVVVRTHGGLAGGAVAGRGLVGGDVQAGGLVAGSFAALIVLEGPFGLGFGG